MNMEVFPPVEGSKEESKNIIIEKGAWNAPLSKDIETDVVNKFFPEGQPSDLTVKALTFKENSSNDEILNIDLQSKNDHSCDIRIVKSKLSGRMTVFCTDKKNGSFIFGHIPKEEISNLQKPAENLKLAIKTKTNLSGYADDLFRLLVSKTEMQDGNQ